MFEATQQLKSEKAIFHNTIVLIQIPSKQSRYYPAHYIKKRKSLGTLQNTTTERLMLETTSKTPFNVSGNDVMDKDVLFISTLEDIRNKPIYQQKQQSTQLVDDYFSLQPASPTSSSSSVSSFSSRGSSTEPAVISQLRLGSTKNEKPMTHGHNEPRQPVWADLHKIKDNPPAYQRATAYLRQHQLSFQSSLPLAKPCSFYFSKNNSKKTDYVSNIKKAFEVDTVWAFSSHWRVFKESYSMKPSQLILSQSLYCFISGVQPMWEDETNKRGGRLVMTIYKAMLLDVLFERLLCAFVGAHLYEDGVVGIIVSKRYKGDRIEIWFNKAINQDELPLFK
ncbi:MAG: translation initiation factor eIF 4e-like domain-containing protein [Benjaminiella poitrasii]|nr:MAG: translation initiation factor eIF 4e-like domain-containing protein [Benjaminiella poitrasii]